jgi:hypothetical protein
MKIRAKFLAYYRPMLRTIERLPMVGAATARRGGAALIFGRQLRKISRG